MTKKFEAFLRLHSGLAKQGPGSDESTRRALSMVLALREEPQVLDIGCGPGRQTLALARLTRGKITAVDVTVSYLEQLNERAQRAGVAERIETIR